MRSPWKTLATGMLAVAAACAPSAAAASIYVRLETADPTVAPGDTVTIEFAIPVADSMFNAFHLVLRFDPSRVSFVPTTPVSGQVGPVMADACGSLFHVFNPYADSTVADVSLLCSQTFVAGPGVIYRQKFRAHTAGVAPFAIGVSSRFYDAGVFETPVWPQGITVVIGNVNDVPRPAPSEPGFVLETPRPNPTLAGASTSVSFKLPARARVAIELFDLQGRKIARHDVGDVPAGRSDVRWTAPLPPMGRYQMRLLADGRVVARTSWVILR